MRTKHLLITVTLLSSIWLSSCGATGPDPAPPQPTDNPSLAQDLPQATAIPDANEPAESIVEDVAEPTDATPTPVPPATVGEDIVSNQVTAGEGQAGITAFSAPADQVIRIEAVSIDGQGAFEVSVRDKFDSLLASVGTEPLQSAVTLSELRLPYDGDYDVVVNSVDSIQTIDITVSVLDGASASGQLTAIGDSIDAAVSEANQFHVYSVSLTEADIVDLGAVATNTEPLTRDLDLRMSLFGPDGALVTSVDDVTPAADLNAVLEGFVVPVTGNFVAVVSNVDGTVGDYQFRLRSADAAAEVPADVVYNAEYTVRFTDGDNLVAAFDGTIGDVLEIAVTDVDFGLDVATYLYNPAGQVIAFASNANAAGSEIIPEIQLPYSGRYTLEIEPVGNGEATFALLPLTVQELTGGGVFGEEAEGSRLGEFQDESVFHMYQFNATAGDTVNIEVINNAEEPVGFSSQPSLDIGFALLAPNGEQLAFADELDPETNVDAALNDFVVDQTGSYIIVVYAFAGGEGRYELFYSRN